MTSVPPARSHYEVLGVPVSASASELRQSYLALARRHHPDRAGGDPALMRVVNEAWAVLGDPERRARYDQRLLGAPPPTPSPAPADDPRSDEDDLRADLADDAPIGGQVVLPRWLAMVPIAVFAASLALLGAGVVFGSAAAMAGSVALFALSCSLFLAAPLVALLSSRRPGR